LARPLLAAVAAATLALGGLYRQYREASARGLVHVPDLAANAPGVSNSGDSASDDSASSSSCITFLGDTMLANLGKDYSRHYLNGTAWSDAFTYIRPLLRRCSAVVANLEGPLTTLGHEHDPRHVGPAYSFAMDPKIIPRLLREELGDNVVLGRANNHFRDRGEGGVVDTTTALEQANIPHFGAGRRREEAARPAVVRLLLATDTVTVGITGYSDLYKAGVLPSSRRNRTGVLPVKSKYVRLAHGLLDDADVGGGKKGGVDLRVAYVHWGDNYKPVSNSTREEAALLLSDPDSDDEDANAAAGPRHHRYDLVVGSDGSHTVQELDYVQPKASNSSPSNRTTTGPGLPVLYNIGNFVFHTPGKFGKGGILPYGTIVHVHVGKDADGGPRFESMELHCTYVANKVVGYRPRICTPQQAAELFAALGPHVDHRPGDAFATVVLPSAAGGREQETTTAAVKSA